MSFLHDVIKIQFTNTGYLPNNPCHLISDEEMFKAFYNEEAYTEGSTVSCFFKDYYYYPEEWVQHDDLKLAYDNLKAFISELIAKRIAEGDSVKVPSWIYSYMLMRPITFESEEIDIAYLYNLLSESSETGQYLFTEDIAYLCYLNSLDWLKRNPSKNYDRPPTIFGETHVTKSLRLAQANIFISDEDLS